MKSKKSISGVYTKHRLNSSDIFNAAVKVIGDLSDYYLWLIYGFVIKELKKRNLIRTRNIVGERGEFLAIDVYDNTKGMPKLQAAPKGAQNVDAISRKGDRYSIKTISLPGSTTGVFYGVGDLDDEIQEKKFEYVIVVLIDGEYNLSKVIEVTWEQFIKYRKWHKTMRAWNLSLTRDLYNEAKIIAEVGVL